MLCIVYWVSDYIDLSGTDDVYSCLCGFGSDVGQIIDYLVGCWLGSSHSADREICPAAQGADAAAKVVESGVHTEFGEYGDRSDPGEINRPSAEDQPDHGPSGWSKTADAPVTDRSPALPPGPHRCPHQRPGRLLPPLISGLHPRWRPGRDRGQRSRIAPPETTGALGRLISPGSERSHQLGVLVRKLPGAAIGGISPGQRPGIVTLGYSRQRPARKTIKAVTSSDSRVCGSWQLPYQHPASR